MSEESWYHASNGKATGPVTSDEIRRLVREKKLGAEDLIWKPGMELWQEIEKVNPEWTKIEEPKPAAVAIAWAKSLGKSKVEPEPVAEAVESDAKEKKGFLSRFFKR